MYFPPSSGTSWDTIKPSDLGYCQANIDDLHDYLETTHSKAFMLLKDGKIVFEWYFGTFTKDSLYVWNSAGKTLSAFAVGIAQQEGYLDIHDTTSNYLGQGWTSLTPEQEEKITILNQLTMTSGLGYVGDWYCTDPSCLIYVADPDTRWSYHNGPYTLLDDIIESATGVNLNTYVNQKIRSKIGMNGFFFPVGYNNINLSNARSMARFGLLLLAEGNWNGTMILNDPAYFQAMTNSSQSFNPSYGYLTWLNGKGSYMIPSPDIQFTVNENMLPNAPDDLYAAMGKDGQIINIVPSEKLVLVRMGEDDGNSLVSNQYNDTIWQKINALTCLGNVQGNSDDSISIYPIPSQKLLHIENGEKVSEVRIFDLSGQSYVVTNCKNQLNIEHLAPGMYIIQFTANQQLVRLRFLKE